MQVAGFTSPLSQRDEAAIYEALVPIWVFSRQFDEGSDNGERRRGWASDKAL